MPKSLPYHDFLISHLKDPNYAAVYLETHFELDEGEEPEPELLRFGQIGSTIVLLLCGGDKSTQSQDIRKAIEYWIDYRNQDNA
ncbi:MAG TPA: hypothetical protein DCL61_12925 [Cyanobacteria bacterium UBA12227]|nr:hypothetical protein [Cyanobacteria bacterium UBA12227]HAX89531.1 hypothetical protein [Cyanobacteria bacterium UBA11370]